MIKLKKIILNNFGAYLGKHELTFPEIGLFSIIGKYEDEPERSNGAGKTFLVRAIAYCLDFAELPSSSLQNYNTEEYYSVSLLLELDDKLLDIYRDKNNYIINYNGSELKSADAKDFIKKNLLDSHLISFVTYRQQDQKGNFLPLKPSEKVEFLSNLLNLDKFQNLIDSSSDKIKIIETDIQLLSSQEDIVRVELFSINDKIDLIGQSLSDLHNKIVKKQNDSLNLIEPKREEFIDEKEYQELLRKKQEVQDSELTKPNDGYESIISEIAKECSLMEMSDSDFESIKSDLIKKLEENKLVNKELDIDKKRSTWINKKINEHITCPNCQFNFSVDGQDFKELQKEEIILNREISHKIGTIESNQDFIQKYKNISILGQLLKKRDILAENRNKSLELFNSRKNEELMKLNYELKFFNERNHKLFEDAKQRFFLQKQNFQLEIDEINNDIKVLEDKIQSFSLKRKGLEIRNDEIKNSLKNKRKEKSYYNELINCLGKENFIRLVTEESLALITVKINDFLSEIPNTEKITVKLSIDKETKKGTLKKNINLQVFSSGIERPYEEFSGGEKCSINLACDTAISEIIAERTGKRFNWFIIDEGQGGMDGVTKLESLQILKKISKNKLILTIDHSNEINEYLDGQIIVLKTKEGSQIVTSNQKSADLENS